MEIEFHGAAGGVTGSAHLITTARARVLLDFGMFQGGPPAERANRRRPGFDPRSLDAVVLSHAHIDHSGRLPLLARWGARPPIWCTPATADLCAIMLPDSAHISMQDAQRWARRRQQRGREPQRAEVQPLYDLDDVKAVLETVRGVGYGRTNEIAPGINLTFMDAGHILGSAIVVLDVSEPGSRRRLVFCGDLGHSPAPLLRDPEHPGEADVLLLESTYGDRDHRPPAETVGEFRQLILQAQSRGGKVLVPSFAVGRTQEIIYHLGELRRAGELTMPVYVDSPMALATTETYERHRELYDREANALLEHGQTPLAFDTLRFCHTPQESMALNELAGPAVIIAASGMCTGGRIVHHLKHHAGKRETTILMVGFQVIGTPGRALVDGARSIMLQGERLEVNATVHTLGGFSAHAGQTELLAWAGRFPRGAGGKGPRTFLVHGEDGQRAVLADLLHQRIGLDASRPVAGEKVSV